MPKQKQTSKPQSRSVCTPPGQAFKVMSQNTMRNIFATDDRAESALLLSKPAAQTDLQQIQQRLQRVEQKQDQIYAECTKRAQRQRQEHEFEMLQLESDFNQFRISIRKQMHEMEQRYQSEIVALRSALERTKCRSSDLQSSDLEK